MKIAELTLQNFRKFSSCKFSFSERINVIQGPNGSGKTSLLESLYLLGTGHSFRTHEKKPLIKDGADSTVLFARTIDGQTLSMQKSLREATIAKINTEICASTSELAMFLPCQIFYQDLFHIIDAGPIVRRQLLDWGVFHVEPQFIHIWKEYRQALKQRNALLKQSASAIKLEPWDSILDKRAEVIHQYRASYFKDLNFKFQQILRELSELECQIFYYKGWDRKNEGKNLRTTLAENYHTDLKRQFTYYGAHHADIILHSPQLKAKEFFSRGQQKVIVFALKLAQSKLLSAETLYLIDDLSAELDQDHLQKILMQINKSCDQFFITCRKGDQLLLNVLADLDFNETDLSLAKK